MEVRDLVLFQINLTQLHVNNYLSTDTNLNLCSPACVVHLLKYRCFDFVIISFKCIDRFEVESVISLCVTVGIIMGFSIKAVAGRKLCIKCFTPSLALAPPFTRMSNI